MAFLGPLEASRVALCRPELLGKLTRLMDAFEKRTGYRTTVPEYGGWRSAEQQTALVADRDAQVRAGGASYRVAPAETSRHPLGAAFDLKILKPKGGAVADRDPLYGVLAEEARKLGLTCGYDFKRGDPDPFHFELTESLETSRAEWNALVGRRLQRTAWIAGALVVITLLFLGARRR